MIEYLYAVEGVKPAQLEGAFFEHWPNPPSPETHLRFLNSSGAIVLAVDTDTDKVVGFINAITDGVLSAYIPLLEVLPEYRERGIGSELVRRLLAQLSDLYMIDLMCDVDKQPFYARCGMTPTTGMLVRNFEHQSGRATASDLNNRKEA